VRRGTEPSALGRRPVGIVLLDGLEEGVLGEMVSIVSMKLRVDTYLLGRADISPPFESGRRRQRADLVINRYVERFSSSSRFCVGLIGADLYMPSMNFVFGLALRSRGLAIVSWHRLRDGGNLFVTRLAKEVIHEVGHLEGLDHCSNESCVMRFSNTLGETDAKGLDFCPACARARG
jgi:predicted Zn-dependent protease